MESPLRHSGTDFWNDKPRTYNDENLPFDSDGLTDTEVVESIEKPDYAWKVSLVHEPLDNRRHISSTTAIHLDEGHSEDDDEIIGYHDDDEDPFAAEDFEEHNRDTYQLYNEDVSRHEADTSLQNDDYRMPSYSTMPGSPSLHPSSPYKSVTPARSNSSVMHTPMTHRSGRTSHNRFMSSPAQPNSGNRYYSAVKTPLTGDRYMSSPGLHQSHYSSHSTGFRNASSIRAMQMSSPSPPPGSPQFAKSPRSARQRRLERLESQGRSASGTPSSMMQHPDPRKEYPLILLHCSFTAMVPAYPISVMNAVLPDWLQENLTLLHEKLNPTVVERGMLIPHPGEDYELLEERILENLELRRPRVGKCGHFISPVSRPETATGTPTNEVAEPILSIDAIGDGKQENHPDFRDPSCTTCLHPVRATHNGTAGDLPHNRFDIRVYAANGLMRSGAWSAAWREMEKVDVEIGVWMPEDVRSLLEKEAMRQACETHDVAAAATSTSYGDISDLGYSMQGDGGDTIRARVRDFTYPRAPSPPPASTLRQRPRSDTLGSATGPASTAACSKPASVRDDDHDYRRQRTRSTAYNRSRNIKTQAPLSELLVKYMTRKLNPTKELFLQLLVLVLAVVVLRQQWIGTSRSPPAVVMPIIENELSSASIDTVGSTMVAMQTVTQTLTVTSEAQVFVTEAAVSNQPLITTDSNMNAVYSVEEGILQACTFSASDAGENGMVALPSAVAKSVLDAVSFSSAAASSTSSTAADIMPAVIPGFDIDTSDEIAEKQIEVEKEAGKEAQSANTVLNQPFVNTEDL